MAKSLTILGLETSCDETAAAIIRLTRVHLTPSTHLTQEYLAQEHRQGTAPRGEILANQIYSQIETHAPYGGVVPELAARAHLSRLDGLIESALNEANVKLAEIDAIAATGGPGLVGGLLIGLTTGKALALATGKPFIAVNHLEGHGLTIRLTDGLAFPYLLLLVSGGHCQLIAFAGLGDYHILGTTRDDAVGEAFDKAAKLLRLGYPGGPAIERLARSGAADRFALPRPLIGADDPALACDFSFSGLKTALRQTAEKLQPLSDSDIADLAASFQAAVLDCLADRSAHAMRVFAERWAARRDTAGTPRFVVAGGVGANQALRQRLQQTSAAAGFTLHTAPPALCTDNAVMIAWAGAERLATGLLPDDALATPARARWPLDQLIS